MSAVNAAALLAAAGGEVGYQISRSVRLRSSASGYLNNASTRTVTPGAFTFSMWFKRGSLSSYQVLFQCADAGGASNKFGSLMLFADDTLRWGHWTGADADAAKSNGVLRDPSAWYHAVFSKPAGGVGTLYLNGVAQTKQTTYSNDTDIFATTKFIGRQYDGIRYFDGYIAEVHAIDGQALTPSSFGETDAITGVWKPKKYAGTYGTNGFYLNFSDNSNNTAATIGKDYSGNGNNFTPNNISVTAGITYDSMLDVPTPYADGGNGRGNYCVLNPNFRGLGGTNTFSNGNLQNDSNRTAANNWCSGTMALPSSGKWYCEVVATVTSSVGIVSAWSPQVSTGATDPQYFRVYYGNNGQKGTQAGYSAYGATFTNANTIGIAVDMDAGTITFYKDNTSQGVAFSDLISSGIQWCFGASYSGGSTNTTIWNFGQRPFAYTPPTGYKALNTQNLPDATIKKGNQYMDASLFIGTGASQNVPNSGAMQPDLVWVKSRDVALSAHYLYDSIRGVTKSLSSNDTNAEYTGANTLTSFNSDGFTVSTGLIQSTKSYVGWQWKESATAGFDIVTWTGDGTLTGRTIAHSLGVTPAMIITKCKSETNNWNVWHKSLSSPTTSYLSMNLTDAVATSARAWGSTAPTSSTFGVGWEAGSVWTNKASATFVAYLFAEVAGFSKFGSYTGNGSADGPFVYLGFRPRFVLVKCSSLSGASSNWVVHDTARDSSNAMPDILLPNLSNAEATDTTSAGYVIDCVANGFKIRNTNANWNSSGATYIYAAFAENPFKNSLAR